MPKKGGFRRKSKHPNPLNTSAYRPFLYLEKIALAIDSKQFKDDDLLGFAYVCALDAIKHRDDEPMRRSAELFHLSEKEFIERGAQAACVWLKVPSVDNL